MKRTAKGRDLEWTSTFIAPSSMAVKELVLNHSQGFLTPALAYSISWSYNRLKARRLLLGIMCRGVRNGADE